MKYSEEYKIGQSSDIDPKIKNYYKWAIWIEPGTGQLSEIQSVEYLLHPTFKERFHSMTDVGTNFRLESKGWGEFMIEIMIVKENGEKIELTHWLTLANEYSNIEESENAELDGKKVYISYSKIDSKMAKVVESLLIDLGMQVNMGSHYEAGVPIEKYIESSISGADLVINIDSNRPTAWHQSELDFAQKQSKEVIPVDNILNAEEISSALSRRNISSETYGSKLKKVSKNLKNLNL